MRRQQGLVLLMALLFSILFLLFGLLMTTEVIINFRLTHNYQQRFAMYKAAKTAAISASDHLHQPGGQVLAQDVDTHILQYKIHIEYEPIGRFLSPETKVKNKADCQFYRLLIAVSDPVRHVNQLFLGFDSVNTIKHTKCSDKAQTLLVI